MEACPHPVPLPRDVSLGVLGPAPGAPGCLCWGGGGKRRAPERPPSATHLRQHPSVIIVTNQYGPGPRSRGGGEEGEEK